MLSRAKNRSRVPVSFVPLPSHQILAPPLNPDVEKKKKKKFYFAEPIKIQNKTVTIKQ